MRAEEAIEEQQEAARAEHRHEEHVQDRRQPEAPDRERHLEPVHAGRAEADDGDDVVDAAHDRRHAGDEDGDGHVRLAPAGRADVGRQRRVGRPAGRGGAERRR